MAAGVRPGVEEQEAPGHAGGCKLRRELFVMFGGIQGLSAPWAGRAAAFAGATPPQARNVRYAPRGGEPALHEITVDARWNAGRASHRCCACLATLLATA
jgi:hypothetical protein